MSRFNFGVSPRAAKRHLGDPMSHEDRWYATVMDLTGFQHGQPGAEFDRADRVYSALWGRRGRGNCTPFALTPDELPSLDLSPAYPSDDTPPATANTTLVAETLVTGLDTAGAPQHTPSAISGAAL